MGLRHAVVTSVDRDDLADGGAGHFRATIEAIHRRVPGCAVEVLTPDFRGVAGRPRPVLGASEAHGAGPEVFSHNVETVPGMYRTARPGSSYERSLELLAEAARRRDTGEYRGRTKTAVMLGLGEGDEEVRSTIRDIRAAGVQVLAMGQYLQPTGAPAGRPLRAAGGVRPPSGTTPSPWVSPLRGRTARALELPRPRARGSGSPLRCRAHPRRGGRARCRGLGAPLGPAETRPLRSRRCPGPRRGRLRPGAGDGAPAPRPRHRRHLARRPRLRRARRDRAHPAARALRPGRRPVHGGRLGGHLHVARRGRHPHRAPAVPLRRDAQPPPAVGRGPDPGFLGAEGRLRHPAVVANPVLRPRMGFEQGFESYDGSSPPWRALKASGRCGDRRGPGQPGRRAGRPAPVPLGPLHGSPRAVLAARGRAPPLPGGRLRGGVGHPPPGGARRPRGIPALPAAPPRSPPSRDGRDYLARYAAKCDSWTAK
jgi:hypothetical protein